MPSGSCKLGGAKPSEMKTCSYIQTPHHSVAIATCCQQLHPKDTLRDSKLHQLILNPFVQQLKPRGLFPTGDPFGGLEFPGWDSSIPNEGFNCSIPHQAPFLPLPMSPQQLASDIYMNGMWPPSLRKTVTQWPALVLPCTPQTHAALVWWQNLGRDQRTRATEHEF